MLAGDGGEHGSRLRVLLITESTYPFRFGGVSTWCRNLIEGLPDVDYHVLALVPEPDLAPRFELPANVSAVTTVPIWGVRQAREFGDGRRFPQAAAPDLERGLGDPLRQLVEAIFSDGADSFALAQGINSLYEHFLTHDFDASMRSEVAWEAFLAGALAGFPAAALKAGYGEAPIGVSDPVVGLHWLYHWLLPLAGPLPEVDVAHATMAGEAVLPAVACKLHDGTGLVFSEHGIYLREIYLREAAHDGSLFLKLLKIGFARRTTEIAYALADQISTCCDYNRRWALRDGTSSERVETIHYGVHGNGAGGSNGGASAPSDRAPVVLWLGRIHPLKDLETLLRAAAIVHRERSDVVFRLYGSAAPEERDYHERLLALRAALGLDRAVELPGYTSDPRAAYDGADIVVLSSISEGFPYATLDAMQCGKPVVATAVGGLREQLGDCGVLVPPQSPEALAAALSDLIDDPSARERMGARARNRVGELFALEEKNRQHHQAYVNAVRSGREPASESRPQVRRHDPLAASGVTADGALIESVAAQVRHPVDDRELAAVLEAGGVSDESAEARYGADDTFELAEAISSRVRATNGRPALRPHQIEPPRRQPRTIPPFADGLMLLIPAAVLVTAGHWARSVHGWTSGTSRALLWGVALSTLLGNAFLFSVMRRGALLIGCDRWSALRKFLWRWSCAAALLLLCADLAAVLVAHWAGSLSPAGMATFGLSFAALIGIWILAGGLFVLQRASELGLATLAGAAVGTVAYFVSGAGGGADTGSRVVIALVTGYLLTVAILATRITALVARRTRGPAVPRLPRPRFLLAEAAPFAAYGGILVALVLGPNLVSALRASSMGSHLRSVALGMTLALVPLMVSVPVAEGGVLAVLRRIASLLSETSAAEANGSLDRGVRDLYRNESARYAVRLAALSAITVPLLWLLAETGVFGGLGVHSKGALLLAFVISVIAYLILGWSQFELALTISWARPGLALRCAAAAAAVSAIVAAITFAAGFEQAGPVSLLAGAGAAAVLAARTNGRFLERVARRLIDAA